MPFWATQITIGVNKFNKSVLTPTHSWGTRGGGGNIQIRLHTVLQHSWQSWGWNYTPPTKARHRQLSLSYSEFLNYPLQNLKTEKWKYPGDFFSSYYQRRASSTATLRLHLSLFQTDNIWWGGLPPAVIQHFAIPTICYPISRAYWMNTILCKSHTWMCQQNYDCCDNIDNCLKYCVLGC